MQLSDLDYHYPEQLIAKHPKKPRDHSRLLVVQPNKRKLFDHHFYEIPQFLKPGDLLVYNDSKVIKCRLIGKKSTGAKLECFLVSKLSEDTWQCLLKANRPIKKDTEIQFGPNFFGRVQDQENYLRTVQFKFLGPFLEQLKKYGHMPLPPYLGRDDQKQDEHDYQTVYAQKTGSHAAPTAGLHFTQKLMDQIKEIGVVFCPVTLHVGLGTFAPVRCPDIRNHQIHEEFFEVNSQSCLKIKKAKTENRRIIAVGTTAVRTLESMAPYLNEKKSFFEKTSIFIYPPYRFQLVDLMITNFHQPQSTLLALVSAFSGLEFIQKSYQHAIQNNYRLFSFGDACLLYPTKNQR